MRKVIGIGETILDIIFKNDEPIGAVPGGSVFNGIISLGRAGVSTAFISETGNDRVGRRIISFLEENHVDASSINVYPESKSPISLAFLNEQNDAEYIFYKDHPHDRLDFVLPEIQPDDIVMFGSYYAVNPVIRQQVQGFLEYARDKGAILYYDVNFRASHQNEVVKLNSFQKAFYAKMELETSLARSLQLAVEEAVINVIDYAYPINTNGDITVTMMTDGRRLRIVIVDSGVAFDPTLRGETDITLSAADRQIGGLGIHLIRQIMTSISYNRINGNNILTLTKQL